MYFRSNKKYKNTISLNDIIAHDKEVNDIALIDIIEQSNENFEDNILFKDKIKNLEQYLNVLSNRELEIIKMRYGLLNTPLKTQKEIAKKLKISRSYVSRIEKRALIKLLRQFIKNKEI